MMSDIIIRALEEEVRAAEQNIRYAGNVVYERFNDSRKYPDSYKNPRACIAGAIRHLELARDRYDNTVLELRKAKGEIE